MGEIKRTPFSIIYDSFLTRVTSDMYMEMTELDTYRALQDILVNAIPRFEFPRFNIEDYEEADPEYGTYCGIESDNKEVPSTTLVGGFFNSKLTKEEVDILSLCMVVEWFIQQLATTENTKSKYSGVDFKFTSQANHMAKLKVMIDAFKQDCFHLQRLYKRRKVVNGEVRSTAGNIVTPPSYGYKII